MAAIWVVPAGAAVVAVAAIGFSIRALAAEADRLHQELRRAGTLAVSLEDLGRRARQLERSVGELGRR